jgi:hypothetical protein
MMKKTKKNLVSRLIIAAVLCYVALCALLSIPSLQNWLRPARYIKSQDTSVTIYIPYEVDGEADEVELTLLRGTQVRLKERGDDTSIVQYNGHTFSIDNDLLANTQLEAIQTDYVYPRRLVNLRTEKGGSLSDVVASAGEELKVVSVSTEDLDEDSGLVRWYEVNKDGVNYWIHGSAIETSQEASLVNYGTSLSYSTSWDEYYGTGYSKDAYIDQLDYKTVTKEKYEDNPMPDEVNAIHISIQNMIYYKDELLALKESTGINAFVVELKGDGGSLYYNSQVAADYMDDPSLALGTAVCSIETLGKLFQEFQDAGYYISGRIVAFKDALFAMENEDDSLVDENGDLYYHNGDYWPSPYSRKVWEYNLAIAKEVAPYVNEIQFDYVRFPDGTLSDSLEGNIDFRNQYNESKTQVIQNFLYYAREELEDYHVYLAADVFAWPIVAKDDQDIGQYIPAIANVVDVVAPMPYADHFSSGAFGFDDPTEHPEELLYEFTQSTINLLNGINDPAIYRTWIMGYSPYEQEEITAQMEGIYEAGQKGYLIWAGGGSSWDVETFPFESAITYSEWQAKQDEQTNQENQETQTEDEN